MQLHFTKNAEDKLSLLAGHEAQIDKSKIVAILEKPDNLAKKSSKLKIARGRLVPHTYSTSSSPGVGVDKKWDLAVVYREDDGVKMVITFYPIKK